MPISLITGPANAGKARLVMDSLRREVARGGEPLLVVPTRADADYYLRELAGDGAVAGVRVERFAGLIEEAVRRAGVSGARLEGIARERVLHSLALRNGVPRPSAGYVRALGELFAELQMRRVSPGRFAGGDRRLGAGRRGGGGQNAAGPDLLGVPLDARADRPRRCGAAGGQGPRRSPSSARRSGEGALSSSTASTT